MGNLFDRFDKLDTALNRWPVAHSIGILRVSIGLAFIVFGLLKFFPGLSRIEGLAGKTGSVLSFGLLSPAGAIVAVAALECAIGLCFLTGRFLRVAVWLMGAQMLGAMSPLVLSPGELFPGPSHAPTLAAQYIIKDLILVAAGLVIAATWTGARIVADPRSMRSTLREGAPMMVRATGRTVSPEVAVGAQRRAAR